jgi:hypothetical protein
MKKLTLSLILLSSLSHTYAMLSQSSGIFSKTGFMLARTLAHKILNDAEKIKIQETAEKFAKRRTYGPDAITTYFWKEAYCTYAHTQVKNGFPLGIILDQWESELYSDTMFSYFLNELKKSHQREHA